MRKPIARTIQSARPTLVAEVGSTANTYQIVGKLAAGGMAEIFLARTCTVAGIERHVVLKRVLRERSHEPAFVQMFLDEIKLATQLQHPNIAQVYDVGSLGESLFFTMEYVHGETIRALLHTSVTQGRELPLGAILTTIAGAAAGLHHAHRRTGHDGRPRGVVHRDVSPSNIMIAFDGTVKVVDFGVAKADSDDPRTRTGEVRGKLAYMSPEQLDNDVDLRTDLFALGVVFWEMLTTQRLYRRPTDPQTILAIVNETPPPPSSLRPGLPREIDDIVGRLLAKDRRDRPASAEALVEHLETIAPLVDARISPSMLGRLMVDVFGERVEPWRELADDGLDGMTTILTGSGTLPSEPEPSAEDEAIEVKLAAVPQLTLRMSAADVPNATLVTSPDVPSLKDGAMVPTRKLVSTWHVDFDPPAREPAPGAPMATLLGFVGPTDRSATAALPPLPAPHEPATSHRRTRLVSVGLAAFAVIGGVSLAVGLSGPGETEQVVATNHARAEPVVDAPAVDASTADAGAEPVVIDAAVIDAAVPVSAAEAIAADIAAGRLDAAYAACAAAPAAAAATCTQVACRLARTSTARRWFAQVRVAERGAVLAACRTNGVALVRASSGDKPTTTPSASADACVRDPMRCRQ